jgi:uncharacterized cupin superfamily protein
MSKQEKKEIGEGDRASARRYNKHAREFVESTKNDAQALKSGDTDEVSMKELSDAETAALERAKEQDPQTSRDYTHPTVSSNR